MKRLPILLWVATLAVLAIALIRWRPVAAQAVTLRDNPLLKFRGLVAACGRSDSVSTIECGSYITGFVHGSQATQEAAVIETVANQVAQGAVPPTDRAVDEASNKAREQQHKLFCIRSN